MLIAVIDMPDDHLSQNRILLTGGGTGGSVTPLLAVAENIKQQYPAAAFLFVGTADGPERALAETAGISFRPIPAGKLRRYWSWRTITDLGGIWRGFLSARRIINDWRPTVVVSAGSYVSVPVVWAGRLAGCRIHIHQQDVRPGLANRLMLPAADSISVTFPKSVHEFPARKVHLTGNPVRPVILRGSADRARAVFHLESQRPVLLVAGGGTGSNFLNQITAVTMPQLLATWEVIHLTGAHRPVVELNDKRYHRFAFLTANMADALAAATVVVSRAGLGLISELAALAKPTIFVPMPATHQEENAAYLAERQAGIVVDQSNLSPASFVQLLQQLLDHPDQRQALGRNLHELYRPEALSDLTAIIIGLNGRRR